MSLTTTTLLEETTLLVASYRVQANPPAELSPDNVKLAISFVNTQVENKVHDIMNVNFGYTLNPKAETSLFELCSDEFTDPAFSFCAELKSTIFVDTLSLDLMGDLLGKFVDYALVDELRASISVADYPSIFDSQITWMGPNLASTTVGWTIDGMASQMDSTQQRAFESLSEDFLGEAEHMVSSMSTVDQIVVSRTKFHHQTLEIHGTVYGTFNDDKEENCETYQELVVGAFNNVTADFLAYLSYDDSYFARALNVEAYAIEAQDDDRSLVANAVEEEDTVIHLKFFDTKQVGLGLVAMFIVIQGLGFLLISHRKQATIMANAKEVETDIECTDTPESSLATSLGDDSVSLSSAEEAC